MHIEVFKGAGSTPENPQWFWHFKNKGRTTADSESFPTKQHAVRAAKGVVSAVGKWLVPRRVVFYVTLKTPDAVHLVWE